MLIGGSYLCYTHTGSDLLPAMDEGGFIVDYIMPAGSSLQETNRVISHVEKILRDTPEVAEHVAAHRPATRPGDRDGSQHRRHQRQAETDGAVLVRLFGSNSRTYRTHPVKK